MIHFIIVSHGHEDYIRSLFDGLNKIESEDFRFYIKDNLGQNSLKKFCFERNITYLTSKEIKGFAANNNEVVKVILSENFVKKDDYYIFLNPDVLLSDATISKLVSIQKNISYSLFTIDLYKDVDFKFRDPSIRRFPRLRDFFTSFFFNFNNSILDRTYIEAPVKVDWFAGSFLAIKSEVFDSLGGFDEAYFMYCEDLDLCVRAHKFGHEAFYLPTVRAVHFTQHQNRKAFNRHLFWHVKSVVIFYIKHLKYLLRISR